MMLKENGTCRKKFVLLHFLEPVVGQVQSIEEKVTIFKLINEVYKPETEVAQLYIKI